MNDNAQTNSNSPEWKNRLFVFGFNKDAPEPYYEFAEKLSKPAA